ncbi:MAG: hypothetical protein KC493_03795 [Bacteriovoracaceae bacterium]|nr:hypothetical protein [Bacteriovoracaceae bacterium]
MKLLIIFLLFNSFSIFAQTQKGDVVVDPAIRLRCEALQLKKNRKLVNRDGLINLLKKNNRLLKNTPYNRTSIIKKLSENKESLQELVNVRSRQIKDLNDFIVRRGCPADNFDLLTEDKIRKFLNQGLKGSKTLTTWNKKKTDYTAAGIGFDEITVDANSSDDLNEIRMMEKELSKEKKDNFLTKDNHIGFSLFRYSQNYVEVIDGLDTLDNSRTASVGLGFYFIRDDRVFSKLVRYYLSFEYAKEGELEVSDDNGGARTFESHSNLALNGGIHIGLWKSLGLYGFVAKDSLTTLYAENPTALNPSDVLGVRNYSLVWVGAGVDHYTSLLTKNVSFSAYFANLLNQTSDVEIDTQEETLKGTRFGFQVGVNFYKKLWGEMKLTYDYYSGSSEMSTARTTFGLRYDIF